MCGRRGRNIRKSMEIRKERTSARQLRTSRRKFRIFTLKGSHFSLPQTRASNW